MDISTLVPLPVRISPELCKPYGVGVAARADLGLLVISSFDKLQVFALPDDIVARCHVQSELAHVRTLGGVAPMEFQFSFFSGFMAFTDGCDEAEAEAEATTALLLVTDGGCRGAVHVIDVVRGTHVGFVAAPGTIAYPQGVATRQSLAAVSSLNSVRVFECICGEECTWTAVREIAVDAVGLRFTADGLRLVMANGLGVSIFCAKDGAFLRDIALVPDAEVYPMDVEECGSEWIMCHSAGLVKVADASITDTMAIWRGYKCSALAVVPVLGLLVVRHDTGVHVLATPDAVAMAAMSSCKVAWMAAVCRAAIARW